MMSNKIVVWDLFGGLEGSARKALNSKKYDIYTFDIRPKTKKGRNNIITNLASDSIDFLITFLKHYPKPNIIIASPMCQSFSRASAIQGGSTGWRILPSLSLSLRPIEDFKDPSINWAIKKSTNKGYWRYNEKDSLRNANLGAKAIENTIAIIKYFKPKHWYIENPAKSLIWNYIHFNLNLYNDDSTYKNIAHYGAYRFPSKKPTIFLSNIELNLKHINNDWKSKTSWEWIKRENRSNIPLSLIREIFKKFNQHKTKD